MNELSQVRSHIGSVIPSHQGGAEIELVQHEEQQESEAVKLALAKRFFHERGLDWD